MWLIFIQFLNFIEEKLIQLSCRIGDEWKKLSAEQKLEWTEKAKHLKLEYQIDCFNDKQAKDGGPGNGLGEGQAKGTPSKKSAKGVGEKRTHQDMMKKKQ